MPVSRDLWFSWLYFRAFPGRLGMQSADGSIVERFDIAGGNPEFAHSCITKYSSWTRECRCTCQCAVFHRDIRIRQSTRDSPGADMREAVRISEQRV